MAIDPAAVAPLFTSAVPFVRTLRLEFAEVTYDHAVMRLEDDPAWRNHVGGPHAGVMFTLAESASGAIVFAHFADLAERATPLPMECTIRFLKIARGPIEAEAVLGRPVPEILAELDAGVRPEFPVGVTLRDASGEVTGEMDVRWTLKLVRPPLDEAAERG